MTKRATKLAKKARKTGLSLVKVANIQRYKMAKQGLFTKQNRKKKKAQKKEAKRQSYHQLKMRRKREAERIKEALLHIHPLSAELSGEDFLDMLDEEELKDMLSSASKKRKKPDPLDDGDIADQPEKKEEENEENPLELQERRFPEEEQEKKKRKLLPIKTDAGLIQVEAEEEEEAEPVAPDSGVGEEADEEEDTSSELDFDEEENDADELPEKSAVDMLVERQVKLTEYKIKIGCLASNIIEDPQHKIGTITSLNRMLTEPDIEVAFTVQKYVALSMLEVFHNLIPNYTVSTHEDPDKLKRETRNLYLYENELVFQYKKYLLGLEKILTKFQKQSKNEVLGQVAEICLKCLCELLLKHPHFNFTGNIIQLVVPYLNNRRTGLRNIASDYICKVFKSDKKGDLSLEVVQRIDRLVRKAAFRVHQDSMAVLLSLRIKHIQNLDTNKEQLLNAKHKMTRNEKLIKKLADKQTVRPSRQQAKEKKKMAKLNAEIKIVLADQDKAVKNKQDTDVIQIIFGLYIHVLKRKPNKKLIGTVLEGLAKFAHLINVEFFSDLLEILAEMMDGGIDHGFTLTHRECLHCIQTVLTILSGQGEVLNIDPHRFYVHLYSRMFGLDAVKEHTNIVTVIKSCNQLLVQRRKKIAPSLVNAFTKRLSTLSLSLLHHGCLPTLAMIRSSLLTHSCTELLLDTDPEGSSGSFCSEAVDPLHSNSSATCLWDLHSLTRHYHPNVCEVARHLLKGAPIQGQGSMPFSFTKLSTEDLYEQFDPGEMKLKPGLTHPDHIKLKGSSKNKFQSQFDERDWCNTMPKHSIEDTDFYKAIGTPGNAANGTTDELFMDFTHKLFNFE